MPVVVTGAAGFIGSAVVRKLVARGETVTAVVHDRARAPRLEPLADRIRIVAAALDQPGAFAAVLADAQADALLHMAWYAQPTDYLVSRENVSSLAMTLRVLESAFEAGCMRVVAAGTCLEYANLERVREEGDPADPASLYASCKHAAWLAGRALARQAGASLTWARLFHLHGPGEDPRRLVPSVVSALRAGQPMALSPGAQIRDHLHVDDAASALVHLLEHGSETPVNVCSGQAVTLRDVLETLGTMIGRPELLNFGGRDYAPGEIMLLAGKPSSLFATGWRPQYQSLEASLRDTVNPEPSLPSGNDRRR